MIEQYLCMDLQKMGFAKNDSDNMTPQEVTVYKKLAKFYLQISDHQVNELIAIGELMEVQQ